LERSGSGVSETKPTKQDSKHVLSVLRVNLVAANNNALVKGEGELPGKINYLVGNDQQQWRTNVPRTREFLTKIFILELAWSITATSGSSNTIS